MLSAQTFVILLLYYFMKSELKTLGFRLDNIYPEKEDFVKLLDEFFETMIDKCLANQGLLDKDLMDRDVPDWYTIIHNFKKINKQIVQVNMFQKLEPGETDVYVFTAYLKPGLHSIIIYDPIENLYYKKTIVVELNQASDKKIILDNMVEELQSEMKRKFRKSTNVFRTWQGDIDFNSIENYIQNGVPLTKTIVLKNAFNNDTIPKNFRPYFFMRDPVDVDKCIVILQTRFRDIKNLFVHLGATRGKNHSKNQYLGYPFITLDRMKDFLEELGIVTCEDHMHEVENDPHV